jgi:histidine triad (HIT) family protein
VQAEVLDPQAEGLVEEVQHLSKPRGQPTNVTSHFPKVHLMAETIFAKIIAKQVPAKIAYEDERYIAIHDIQPAAPVHLLVIPKKEIPTLNDLTPADAELVGGMFLVAKKLMGELGHRDYRTVFNCGRGAQQSVFHIHLHVLAGREFTWPPG